MPFVFLLLFALVSFQGVWPKAEWLDLDETLLLPWAMVLVFWLLAAGRVQHFRRQLVRHPTEHGKLWRQFVRGSRRHVLLLTACYVGVLFGLGWGYVGRECSEALRLPALAELIQFAPFVFALLLSWKEFYHAERISHELTLDSEPFIGPWAYLRFQVRHNLLLVVPPVVLTVTLRTFFLIFPGLEQYDLALAIAGLALMTGAVVSVPLILRVFLGLRPMAPGPLRTRLEATARRLGFGFNNILVWDTRHSVANAMVSGALPWMRYIVLTDLLIDRLTPDEVEAVFGHEVGHIKHHHMVLYILFFVGSLALLTGLWKFCEGAAELAQAPAAQNVAATAGWSVTEVVAGPVLLTAVSVYVVVVFGFLSRRCERQADLFGCRTVSCAAFISALEKVADLNGIPRHRAGWLASWQHPSIAERVEFIERVRDNPALEPHFQRSLLRLKLGLVTGLTVGLAVMMLLVAWQFGPEHVWDLFRVR